MVSSGARSGNNSRSHPQQSQNQREDGGNVLATEGMPLVTFKSNLRGNGTYALYIFYDLSLSPFKCV